MGDSATLQKITIKDERLEIDRIGQYRLSFFLSDTDCQLTVFDVQKRQILLFEQRELRSKLSIEDNLDRIYDEHILIAAGYWKEIQVFIRNRKFALVPSPIFDRSLAPHYVMLNESTDPEEDLYHFKNLDLLGTTVAFGYPKNIRTWFEERYPNVSLFFNHQSIGYMKAVQQSLLNKLPSSFYLSLNEDSVLLAGFNYQRLAIYNQVRFTKIDQLIKIIFLSIKQFSEEGQKTPVVVYGVKEKVDLNMPVLKKYFPNIQLGERPKGIVMHPIFNELEDHEYVEVLANL